MQNSAFLLGIQIPQQGTRLPFTTGSAPPRRECQYHSAGPQPVHPNDGTEYTPLRAARGRRLSGEQQQQAIVQAVNRQAGPGGHWFWRWLLAACQWMKTPILSASNHAGSGRVMRLAQFGWYGPAAAAFGRHAASSSGSMTSPAARQRAMLDDVIRAGH